MTVLVSILSSTVVVAVSLLYATIGEIFSQRAGIMNLGLEGIMLMGCCTGYMTDVATHNLGLSLLVAATVGIVIGVVYAFLTVTLKADQTVCGLAMLTFGTGLSGFIGKNVTSVAANHAFQNIAIPGLSKIPVIGEVFFNQNIMVYAMYIIVPLAMYYIYRTRYGLLLRSLGENPGALDATGYNVFAMRYGYVMFGCMMTTIAGAYLSLAYTNLWNENMVNGKGWIAAALVIFGSWNPVTAVWGAVLFGGVSVLANYFQLLLPQVPSQFMTMLPYILTILVLIITTGNFRKKHVDMPAALTVPYDRENR
ncbi:MAG: ABC transporter permease [Lachnospiraceae bacterium]|nr:ABC transporter permease [Lachnospiraceae bacterium]